MGEFDLQVDFGRSQSVAKAVIDNIRKVIVGKDESIRHAVIALMCGGHVLLEDVPGVGKTILARSMARSLGCSFKRIQFTPDLLPTDVTGVSIYDQKTESFKFREGPIISQIVLADEINRATPKTQSATLEAMEEGQVTVEGNTIKLPSPFMVMATQNPIEYEGTFPLPEAQLDRFFVMISLGYPSFEEEMSIIESQKDNHPIESLNAVASAVDITDLQESRKAIYVDELVREYIVRIITSTRQHGDLSLGASPRASLALFKSVQALALLEGRDYALPDDVKALALPVVSHRLIISSGARVQGRATKQIVEDVISSVEVPGARSLGWFKR